MHSPTQTWKVWNERKHWSRFPNMYYRFTFHKPQIGAFHFVFLRIMISFGTFASFVSNVRIRNDMCASVIANQKWKPENRMNVADIVILVKFTTEYPFLNSFIRILFPIWFECITFSARTEYQTGFDVEIQNFISGFYFCCCCHCNCSNVTKYGHKCTIWILDWRFRNEQSNYSRFSESLYWLKRCENFSEWGFDEEHDLPSTESHSKS